MGKRLQGTEQKQNAANVERESAIKEAAELKGQVKALKTQNSELVAKLTERTTTSKKGKQE